MKKLLCSIVIIALFMLGACDSSNNTGDDSKVNETKSSKESELTEKEKLEDKNIKEKDILKSKPTVVFATNIEALTSPIGEEEYKKYNEIMDYLYDHPEKEEDLLFKELESIYNESAEELNAFIQSNMQDVINYEMGKSEAGAILEENDIQHVISEFFQENAQNPSILEIDPVKSDIDITALRAIAKGEFKYGGKTFNYIIKTEHTKDLKSVEVFQLKINKYNIDFN